MYLKLIACDVFTREVCNCVARTPHVVDIEFTEKGAHDKSDYLNALLQEKIDLVEESNIKYDAILLCYGLCGNATVNLVAGSTKLVIPRAHDCCTIFLGSRGDFMAYFGDSPSTPFTSAGYIERGDSFVHEASFTRAMGLDKTIAEYTKLYGEENARYILETMNPNRKNAHMKRFVYIEMPGTEHLGYETQCREQAKTDGTEFVKLPGSIRLVEKLIFGEWDDEFLVVEPGRKTVGIYDMDEVIGARDVSG